MSVSRLEKVSADQMIMGRNSSPRRADTSPLVSCDGKHCDDTRNVPPSGPSEVTHFSLSR